MKKNIYIILGVILGVSIISLDIYFSLYKQNSPTTATRGFIFRNTVNLNAYKHISSGNNLFGDYKNYSRSDRHDELITIYCNEYCNYLN